MSRLAKMLLYYCNIYDGFLVGISERNIMLSYSMIPTSLNVLSFENSEHTPVYDCSIMTATSGIVFSFPSFIIKPVKVFIPVYQISHLRPPAFRNVFIIYFLNMK